MQSLPMVSQRNFPLGPAGTWPFTYADLYVPQRLEALYHYFAQALAGRNLPLAQRLQAYHAGEPLSKLEESALLVEVGQAVGSFVACLFDIEHTWQQHAAASAEQDVVFSFKHEFIGKRVRRHLKQGRLVACTDPHSEAAYAALQTAWERVHPPGRFVTDPEWRAACMAMGLLKLHHSLDARPAVSAEALENALAHFKALQGALAHPILPALAPSERGELGGQDSPQATLAHWIDILERFHAARLEQLPWVSYQVPASVDPSHTHLIALQHVSWGSTQALQVPAHMRQGRQGFNLTDQRMDLRQRLDHVDYCLVCHLRQKDSCRHGFKDKQTGAYKKNPLGLHLHGCPLDERISEAHQLRKQGDSIAALAMICLDNPMCPGTGHRICNDCMKACIFQKQEPVNIPQIETGILTEVLGLPFGFEIYGLLTRWNPLNRRRPYPRPYHGHNVLVVGLGPAGYTLAHYLAQEGWGVVGIDALKLEPLPSELTGSDGLPPQAVYDVRTLEDALDERTVYGFGGVAEYGITVRWDKNFLKIIYLTLARNPHIRFYGGVRLGGSFTLDNAWDLGFHHIALATGAGRPTLVPMRNNLPRGMRAASDFLMNLQLGGASKRSGLANLQIELPAVVIGGGLTAIDTATELAAYYPVQVEKLFDKAQALGQDTLLDACDPEEQAILRRMLTHGRLVHQERLKSHPDVPSLVRQWGGVGIAYRRSLIESPAYRLNHEEVQKALGEGIFFLENLTPLQAMVDEYEHIQALKMRHSDGRDITLQARCVMVAAGTSPNSMYEREYPGTFQWDAQGRFFLPHRLRAAESADAEPILEPASPASNVSNVSNVTAGVPTDVKTGFFTSYHRPGRRFVSYYGDNHPHYAGNVVKAMASAKDGYPFVAGLWDHAPPAAAHVVESAWTAFLNHLNDQWMAYVHQVLRLTPTIVEIIVHAPMQAQMFQPGQFYRLQNYESLASQIDQPHAPAGRLVLEELALTGAWVDKERGLLSLIVLEMGVSSRLCAQLKPGEPVVVMGPTGTPTHIPTCKNVVLCGGGLGNAVLLSVAKAMQERGNRVVYFAAYRSAGDLFKRQDIEQACDQVVWSVDSGAVIPAHRPQDLSFSGTIVQAMHAYAQGALGGACMAFQTVDWILSVGSDRMMKAVCEARHGCLKPYLNPHHQAVASINAPMQCMMKEVCARCLQRHVDPQTQEISYVFTCFNQDQCQDNVDWSHLSARLRQNTVLEKVSNVWLDANLSRQQKTLFK